MGDQAQLIVWSPCISGRCEEDRVVKANGDARRDPGNLMDALHVGQHLLNLLEEDIWAVIVPGGDRGHEVWIDGVLLTRERKIVSRRLREDGEG